MVPVDYEYGDGISVQQMLASGKIRAFYDILDVSTLSQDAAGTTPVTATGQPIGRVQDKSIYGKHATQITGTKRPVIPAAGYRLRSDFIDDVLESPALDAETTMYINTPHGWYKSPLQNSAFRLPLCDATQIICGNFSVAEELAIARLFGTSAQWAVWLSPNTTISNLRCYTGGGTTTLTFVGNNGATVTKDLSLNSDSSFNLASDGLTAPIAVVWPEVLRNSTALSQLSCNGNQFTGTWPGTAGNPALAYINCHINQFTGTWPGTAGNPALNQLSCSFNQFTGTLQVTAGNTALAYLYCSDNKFTGYTSAVLPATLGYITLINNLLSASAVNTLLADVVAAGRTTGTRTLSVGGTGNAAPTGQGLTDKATLIARGWTVYTN